MPNALRRNAIVVAGLALLFYWAFMFAKHAPALRNVIPFGDDPYDAVGSFASVVGVLIAGVALVRAFRPFRSGPPSSVQRVYLIRSQEAVVLAVLIALAADAVAMVRHPALWIGSAARLELLELLGGMGAAALLVHALVRRTQEVHSANDPRLRKKAAVVSLLALGILAVYPEQLIARTLTHLLTVVAGAVLLFAPMGVALEVLVPLPAAEEEVAPATSSKYSGASFRWAVVALAGALIGTFAFVGEMREGGSPLPVVRLLFVAGVFIGLGLSGLLVAYWFVGGPLGLGPRSSGPD